MILDRAAALLMILLIEAAVGYPQALYRRVRHPVAWIGLLITTLEKKWNAGSESRRSVAGCALLVMLVAVAGGVGWSIEYYCGMNAPGAWEARKWPAVIVVLVATTAIAQRSLHDHVVAVLQPLQAGDLAAARRAVARIVGRDTEALDAQGVSAAAVESLAESFCDGIIAPALWFMATGLPGLFIYKAINTADSIVGHKDARYRAFGWAAARADDLVNLVPARISGLLICVAGCGGWRVMFRDAHKHASPNGGWPEAAMAGALALQLGGPVSYDGEITWRPQLGIGRRPDPASLRTALHIYWRACVTLWLIVGGIAWLR